ncbi:helix-turn-helix transcriptional regulator [Actinomycetaceae bacterium MB13-C1-2]|nr:helix-turn-helix transcriptional regulator [Actinomycetaceae bacterium MB13-C1-2]
MLPVELVARREQLGLSQSALAEALAVAQTSISKYELGTREVPDWMEDELTGLEALQESLIEGFFDLVQPAEVGAYILLPLDPTELAGMNRGRPLPESFARVAAAQARLSLVEDGKRVGIAST